MYQTNSQSHATRGAAARSTAAVLVAVVAILAGFTSVAQARQETIRWTHPAADIEGFRVYSSATPGSSGSSMIEDIILAEAAESDGAFFRELTIADDATVYITVTAYNADGVESFRSNQNMLVPPPPPDRDDDGVPDADDAFPDDPTESVDTDGDGHGDNSDRFVNDASEWQDSDGDGYGNNADLFDNDATEWADRDGDGYGDNFDAFPDDPTRFEFTVVLSPYRVNAGETSTDHEASNGKTWTRDTGFWNTGNSDSTNPDTAIAGTAAGNDEELYRVGRTDAAGGQEMQFSFPLSNGAYMVRLHFAEHVYTAADRRVFHVEIEGVRVLQDFDIFAEAGQRYRALVRNHEVVVTDGVLEVLFVHRSNRSDPTIMAIEVVSTEALEGEVLTTPGKPYVIDVN